MTIKDIDFILELAQTQNFNCVVENLYTAQPTLEIDIILLWKKISERFRIFRYIHFTIARFI